MNGDTLAKLYSLNAMTIENNLEGFTEQDAMYQPDSGGNCANWILGHIVATRSQIMENLNQPPFWNEEQIQPYLRGSAPITDAESVIPLSKMLDDFKTNHEKFLAMLKQMTEDELKIPINGDTMYERLAFLQFHEAYHAGQLGLIRRLVGKSGAI
jgi:hypothetical protein